MSTVYSSKASQKLIYGSNSDDKATRSLECCFYSYGWAIGSAI